VASLWAHRFPLRVEQRQLRTDAKRLSTAVRTLRPTLSCSDLAYRLLLGSRYCTTSSFTLATPRLTMPSASAAA
jgi:hypothetical protein